MAPRRKTRTVEKMERKPPRSPVRQTPTKNKVFLDALAEGKSVATACARSGYKYCTVYEWRANRPEFAAAWAEAVERSTQMMEEEAIRRATEGTEEDVYHNGAVVGKKRKHSDNLLMFMLKARDPDKYRDNRDIKHTVTIEQQSDEQLRQRLIELERSVNVAAITGPVIDADYTDADGEDN